MTAPKSNAERLRKLYEAFDFGGAEAAGQLIDETFDPEVEFNPLEAGEVGGRTYRGRDGVLAFFGEMHDAVEEVRYESPQFHSVGDDLVVVFTRLVGTERDTAVPMRQDLSLVYEFLDGRARCVTAYDSPAEALEAAARGHADA
ncbi:MAG TPA: nuclear transport factor 2 family protein [Solirubrobacterales bacterium]|jgi:ketosteroid isomerase-like protein